MGISLKSIAKKSRVKAANDLRDKVLFNQTAHALVQLQLQGVVNKFPKRNKDGKVEWYWGMSEWFDENGNYLKEHFAADSELP